MVACQVEFFWRPSVYSVCRVPKKSDTRAIRLECNSTVPRYDVLSQRRLVSIAWVENMIGHIKLAVYFCIAHVAWCTGAHAQQVTLAPAEASNMKLVGTNDLQA